MEQNQTIVIAVLAVIVVIAVVAVVMMNNNSGGDAGVPSIPAVPGTTVPSTPGPSIPSIPSTPTGSPIICDMSATDDTYGGSVMGTTILAPPDKMRVDMSMSNGTYSVDMKIIMNGDVVYVYSSELGVWVKGDTNDPSLSAMSLDDYVGMTPAEIEAEMYSGVDPTLTGGIIPTVSCRYGSVSASDFELPAGAQVLDPSAMGGY